MQTTHLVNVRSTRINNLHPIAVVRKVLVQALLLLRYQSVAFDADDESFSELLCQSHQSESQDIGDVLA